jgi:hypothetical protein
MGGMRRRFFTAVAAATVAIVAMSAGQRERDVHAPREHRPTTAEVTSTAVDRLSRQLRDSNATGEMVADIRKNAEPVLASASKALSQGRTLLAINRLSAIWGDVEAGALVAAHPAARNDQAAFEAEWKRNAVLARRGAAPDLRPAYFRAHAEASLLQAPTFYNASLDYSRSTTPEAGLYYLGLAQGRRSFIDFLRSAAETTGRPAPQLRALKSDIDNLQHELLIAYRPPASIERHPEFITASALVNEARELDAAGLRYGALLRYLDAAMRTARITAKLLPREEIRSRLAELKTRLDATAADDSIAQMFVEAAEADVEANDPPRNASAVVTDVLPRYFRALGAAPDVTNVPKPLARVTLVRWPYT